jgi:FtsP/CotA-like multicopper oxidase with cupredoxin domain
MRLQLRPSAGAVLVVLLSASIVHTANTHSRQGRVSASPTASTELIVANDNRIPAGALVNGTLTIRLEARLGQWHPDGNSSPGVTVKAFSANGGPLHVPGPLIRVRQGATVRASVRNVTREPVAVHGLYSRPGSDSDVASPLVVAPGETREVTFLASTPGMYYYWAATDAATTLAQRLGRDTQLIGAFVVDAVEPTPPDRVIVFSTYTEDLLGLPSSAPSVTAAGTPARVFRYAMNGVSWPHTERLTYNVGDTVRMRLANVGSAVHPMHLHGFYFNVDTRGDERQETVLSTGSPRLVVTERMASGQTFSLTWRPTRPGNWLFHCHDNVHVVPQLPFGGHAASPIVGHRHEGSMDHMMAGPVMGITVSGRNTERVTSIGGRRSLRLVVRVDEGGTPTDPAFGYTLHEGRNTSAPAGPYLPGPTILLKRSQPVSITVDNQLPEPTSVHWHGIELESYYDGVAGFAGQGRRLAPAIGPGKTFEAKFTPPRSGTFIYHTHLDDVRQQRAGLSGALLVLDDPASYDPARDWVMLVTTPRKAADVNTVLLNGTTTPAAREMRAGERYRLRFINVHTNRPSMRMRLLDGETLVRWRIVAKDGMDLPTDQLRDGTSEIQMGNGETYDAEFVPTRAGELRLDITNAIGGLLTSMPIHVR